MNERSVFSILHFFPAFSPFLPAIFFLISGTNEASLTNGRAREQDRAPLAQRSTQTRAVRIKPALCRGQTRPVSASHPARCAPTDHETCDGSIRVRLGRQHGMFSTSFIMPAKTLHLLAQRNASAQRACPAGLRGVPRGREKGQGEMKGSAVPIAPGSAQRRGHGVRRTLRCRTAPPLPRQLHPALPKHLNNWEHWKTELAQHALHGDER